MKRILVTGGAGFIGSALCRYLIGQTDVRVLNLDKLTYAGNLESLLSIKQNSRYQFVQGDIADRTLLERLFADFHPDIIMHLAAESHVDRSIDGPAAFIQTNLIGTFQLLEAARDYYNRLPAMQRSSFLFHHISTDEVYGSLEAGEMFNENTAYDPSSPYSATKAGSDHLVRAWHRTYGLPVIVTNCSNNYGPYQFPEKLIPLTILNALEGKPLPVYGDGQQIRDWLFVEDHVRALYQVVTQGRIGETYNIGGHNEKTNLEVVQALCALLDEFCPLKEAQKLAGSAGALPIRSYQSLITFVEDRPGHDRRYAIDAQKIANHLGWAPQDSLASGLRKTVRWYIDNADWCNHVQDGSYQRQRLGVVE